MNKHIQRAVGEIVENKPPGLAPDLRPLFGRWMRLEPRLGREACVRSLRLVQGQRPERPIWTYLGYGPFADFASFGHGSRSARRPRSVVLCLCPARYRQGRRHGCFHALDAPNGVIEIGHIWMSPALQKTREATRGDLSHDAPLLSTNWACRRLEWKCDALNAPSRRAAKRFGFTFEGIFRQHFIVKGRNRDTAWFSIIDKEWPAIREGVPGLAQGREFRRRRPAESQVDNVACPRAEAGGGCTAASG